MSKSSLACGGGGGWPVRAGRRPHRIAVVIVASPRHNRQVVPRGGDVKAAIYARVSTSNGEQNPETQLDELRTWAQRLGHDVVAEYVDRVSGAKAADERPALAGALQAAHERRHDVLLVWALDRLSRGGIGATAGILDRLRRSGVALKSYKEPWLDTAAPGVGELLTAVFSWVAQQERERIRERVRAGLARAQKHGTRSGRPIGRPRVHIDRERAQRAVEDAGSLRGASQRLGVSVRSLRRSRARRRHRPRHHPAARRAPVTDHHLALRSSRRLLAGAARTPMQSAPVMVRPNGASHSFPPLPTRSPAPGTRSSSRRDSRSRASPRRRSVADYPRWSRFDAVPETVSWIHAPDKGQSW
jgi:DNA invertase Pin-like site-specific DNA recombinase